eukprot:TRINITY_DN118_c0_g1_i6.p2 TRINITY_DN118_c0_g1~~TRINITY_DN118_c0_g1_i6.p2  ORF type:complete len:135 (-),score=43.45 TRINITY_DN118_c0_g1_i6:712-1116(-)
MASNEERDRSPNNNNNTNNNGDRLSPRDARRSVSPKRSNSPLGNNNNNNNNDGGRETQTLYVAGLSISINERDVEDKFAKYGKIVSCRLMKDPRSGESRGIAFIRFDTPAEASEALRHLDRTEFDGQQISVEKV